MSYPFKERRRVVSRASYLVYVSKKSILLLLGWFLFLFGLLGITFGSIQMAAAFWFDTPGARVWIILLVLPACLLAIGLDFLVVRSGIGMIDKAERLESMIPLTRHTATRFSSEESLVRASSEPLQAQEGILLRAASSSQEAHTEQLLQAVTQRDGLKHTPLE